VTVVGELGFARWYLSQPCIAVTGTNGKSTVTTFVGELLDRAGYSPFVGGNLGDALSTAVGGDFDALVVEVSSYQLERSGGFRPDVGLILNLTPDHLARHGDMQGYATAKASLFSQMSPEDLGVLPLGSDLLEEVTANLPGRRAHLGRLPGVIRTDKKVELSLVERRATFDLSALRVTGDHNRSNAAAALFAAWSFGADPEALQAAIPHLTGLPHRMEVIFDGSVRWIDDSKATNVEATAAALAGLDRPAVVLLGGQAKGPGFAALAPLLARHRAALAFGASGPEISAELSAAGSRCPFVGTMDEAVAVAARLARVGDAVLLSPGCASFDAFTDFTHRGRAFRSLAREAQ
jgi:UDP-N-acetylmuramoylalanine--D-glutamate ligase